MKHNPYEFPAVPSHKEIMRQKALEPSSLLKRIEQLEKSIKRLQRLSGR